MRRFVTLSTVWHIAMIAPMLQGNEFVAAKERSKAIANPPTLAVAAVQMRSSRDLSANLAAVKKWLRECSKKGIRVAVFPECALTGYFDAPSMKALTTEQLARLEESLCDACRENRIYAVAGTPQRAGKKLYNSALVVNPAGRVIERYHKIHLAEPWPMPGDHLSVFKIDGIPCSIIICHDERYPELVRLPVIAGARVIFYLSHESGIRAERKLAPYRAQIQARAVENGVYVVHANAPANDDQTGSHGQSRLIAPDGNIIEEAGIFDEAVVTSRLDLRKATGNLAKRSADGAVLRDWWQDGVKRVRLID